MLKEAKKEEVDFISVWINRLGKYELYFPLENINEVLKNKMI